MIAAHAIRHGGLSAGLRTNGKPRESATEAALAYKLVPWQMRLPEVTVRRLITADDLVRALLDQARHAQLLVVGSRGRGGLAATLFGSVSAAVLHESDTPVIIARQQLLGGSVRRHAKVDGESL